MRTESALHAASRPRAGVSSVRSALVQHFASTPPGAEQTPSAAEVGAAQLDGLTAASSHTITAARGARRERAREPPAVYQSGGRLVVLLERECELRARAQASAPRASASVVVRAAHEELGFTPRATSG